MTTEQLRMLNKVWDYDEGFLGQLRQVFFNEELYKEFYAFLIDLGKNDDQSFSKEIVSALWFIPVFMERQKDIVCKTYPKDTYFKHQEDVIDAIAGILGYP
jgi:hypothetical protein